MIVESVDIYGRFCGFLNLLTLRPSQRLPNIISKEKQPFIVPHNARHQALGIGTLDFLDRKVRADYGWLLVHYARVDDVVNRGAREARLKLCAEIVQNQQIAIYEMLFGLLVLKAMIKVLLLELRYDVRRRGIDHVVPAIYERFCNGQR